MTAGFQGFMRPIYKKNESLFSNLIMLSSLPQDLAGVFINGCDCLLISEWKTDRKIIALAPYKEGRGDIIIATHSGGYVIFSKMIL